jgi:hypothetical protein
VTSPAATSIRLFAEGKIDAFMGFPPEPKELRARKVGHVIVNTSVDRPWSQYFCCMVFAHRLRLRGSLRYRPCDSSSVRRTLALSGRSGRSEQRELRSVSALCGDSLRDALRPTIAHRPGLGRWASTIPGVIRSAACNCAHGRVHPGEGQVRRAGQGTGKSAKAPEKPGEEHRERPVAGNGTFHPVETGGVVRRNPS